MSAGPERPLFSAEDFFAQQPPPPRLQQHLDQVKEFVERNATQGRRVVLVTSGGTTVPLEHNVVRFLDNFSAGTRGAASAEHFLRTGNYAVIFLHRQHSLQPFSRHYSHSTNPFLDLLTIVHEDGQAGLAEEPLDDGYLFPPVPKVGSSSPSLSRQASSTNPSPAQPKASTSTSKSQIHISPPHLEPMLSLLRSYKLVKQMGILHSISFTSIDEYLFLLRGVSRVMGCAKDQSGQALGRRGMYYLAAAVSDFFIPKQRMSEHKIQSGKGSLTIEMDQVPKTIKSMVDEWSNDGFVVSFKLETDSALLIPKSRAALERYGHQVVIGNTLADRKHEVVFVENKSNRSTKSDSAGAAAGGESGETWVRLDESERETIGHDGAVREIEQDIIARLQDMHDAWIRDGRQGVADGARVAEERR